MVHRSFSDLSLNSGHFFARSLPLNAEYCSNTICRLVRRRRQRESRRLVWVVLYKPKHDKRDLVRKSCLIKINFTPITQRIAPMDFTAESVSPVHPPLSQPRYAVAVGTDTLPMDTDTPTPNDHPAGVAELPSAASAGISGHSPDVVVPPNASRDDGNGPAPHVLHDVFTAGAYLFPSRCWRPC